MEDGRIMKEHRLTMVNRENCTLSGVSEVLSFDEETVILCTDVGKLTIHGKELKVLDLDVEKGKLTVEGRIESLIYTEIQNIRGLSKKFIGRMFR